MFKKTDLSSDINMVSNLNKGQSPKHQLQPFEIFEQNNQQVVRFISDAKSHSNLSQGVFEDIYPPDPFSAYRTIRNEEVANLLIKGLLPKLLADKRVSPLDHSQRSQASSYISFTKDFNQTAGWSSTVTQAGKIYPASNYFIEVTFPKREHENKPYFLDLTSPQALAANKMNANNVRQLNAMNHNQELLIHGILSPPYITAINRTQSLNNLDMGLGNNLRSILPTQKKITTRGGIEEFKGEIKSKLEKLNSSARNEIRAIFPRFDNQSPMDDIVNAFSNMKLVQGYTTGDTKNKPWDVAVDTVYSNPDLLEVLGAINHPDLLNSLEVLQRHEIKIPEVSQPKSPREATNDNNFEDLAKLPSIRRQQKGTEKISNLTTTTTNLGKPKTVIMPTNYPAETINTAPRAIFPAAKNPLQTQQREQISIEKHGKNTEYFKNMQTILKAQQSINNRETGSNKSSTISSAKKQTLTRSRSLSEGDKTQIKNSFHEKLIVTQKSSTSHTENTTFKLSEVDRKERDTMSGWTIRKNEFSESISIEEKNKVTPSSKKRQRVIYSSEEENEKVQEEKLRSTPMPNSTMKTDTAMGSNTTSQALRVQGGTNKSSNEPRLVAKSIVEQTSTRQRILSEGESRQIRQSSSEEPKTTQMKVGSSSKKRKLNESPSSFNEALNNLSNVSKKNEKQDQAKKSSIIQDSNLQKTKQELGQGFNTLVKQQNAKKKKEVKHKEARKNMEDKPGLKSASANITETRDGNPTPDQRMQHQKNQKQRFINETDNNTKDRKNNNSGFTKK